MGWVDLDQLDDEEKKKKLEEKYTQYQKEIQDNRNSYLQQTGLDKIYNGDYSNSNDGFNTAGRNDYAVKPSIWNQIKTTASNMLGNTGYGIGNGLIGFAQNERRNQTATKALKSLGLASGNFGFLFLNKLEGLEKSLKSTLDYTLKDNNTYNSLTKAYEDNKNNILNKIDERLQKQEDINDENIQKNIQETTNPIGQKLVEIAPSLGQMIPSAIPGIGTLYSVGSATDSYYDEAKSRGMNDEQASNYSQIMGIAEGLTEQIGVGKLVKGGKGIAKGTIKEAFKDFGIGVADNFIQEAVIEPISEVVTKATAGDEYLKNDYRTSEGWKNLGKDMLQSGFDGAITAGIMGGVSAGLGKSINVYNKLRNGQQPTVEEYKSAYTEQRENGIDVDGNVQNEFINRINKSIQDTNKNNSKSIDTSSMNLVDSAKVYNINGNDKTIQSINQKLNDRGIASRFDGNLFTNADGTPNKNINALWRTTTDENGNTHREIVFNPYVDGDINEQKTMQQVTIHEMLHDMAGDKQVRNDLFNLVLDKNKTRDGYRDARSNLEEMYSQVYDKNSKDFKDLVDEEEVADTLAQKLGDQDFINSLNKEKPNVFKRIYNWVVDKLNKFTGSKNEKIYWEDVKNKFESAYKQDYQRNGNIQSKYSFVGEKGLNNAIKQDTQFIEIERGLNKAKQLRERGIDNETIRQNTNWFQDKNGDWKFEISDKNMRIKKNLKIKDNTTYRLGDIIEHDNLFTMYPELKNIKINFKNDKNIGGNYKNNMIILNKELINNKARIESTLIHEIQHAIQETEGFETGITSRLSKKAYYENLGEIEADDVTQRFIKEKYKNESLKNTIPESSKKNPKHRKYNTYMKNRGVIDKIKDGVFKYPKKDGNNDEIYQKDMEQTNKATLQNSDRQIWNRLNKNSVIDTHGAWQSFLENQIGPKGKGKTVQELRLPTKENMNTIKHQNIINQNNKERLKDIGITENSDIVTNGNNENIDEEKIANILTEMPTKEKEKSRALAILKANILDKGIVFEELSRKTKNRELQGKWDYTLTASARGQNAIGNPRYEFDSKTKTQKLISKSLESIREEVGKNIIDFNEYMYHQLNIDRMTLEERFGGDTGINYERKNQIKNKPVFGKRVTAKVSQNIVNKYEKNNPEFKKWAKDIYDFLDANTQELEEMYPHYVPISRVDNKGNAIAVPLDTRRTGVNSPIKRAKGGNSDIKPLFETIADRTLQTYRASARNNFGVELLNTLQTVQNAEKIDVDNLVEEITNSEDGTLLKKGTGTVPPSFTVFINGEKVTFEISKDMYDALRPVSEGLSYRNKTLNKISNFRRGVLTEYNPVFMITNSLKDIQDVVVNSQHTAKTISKLPEAYSQILEKGYWYNEYIQNGGEQNSYFNANDGSFENDKKVSMGKNIATMPLRAISKVNNIIEMSPRLAEYIASREKGRSIETSMLDASRVTTNFKAGGNVTKFLNRNGATFLNASVQGAMQQVRNIQEAKVKGLKGWTALACKYAVAGLPVILLNNILWKDDEDYENLQDYVKDSYYCIAKYGDGKFIRIPK